jgi:hypothetical protein
MRCLRDQGTAGGNPKCNPIAVKAFGTLLAAAGPCDQQDNADIMMDFSKKLGSNDMIRLTQIFAQQPRNSVRCLNSAGKGSLHLDVL